MIKLLNADCIDEMKRLADEDVRVDSIVTDPPYELGFMGKSWDSTGIAFQTKTWELAYSLLKPGGHLLAFSGSRTYHRMAVAIEDAGFEIRDQIMWLYGSGFPKSRNIGNGLGTALKPAHEPIVMARKPVEGTVAENLSKHGTGGINIDECRIESDDNPMKWESPRGGIWKTDSDAKAELTENEKGRFPANVIHDGSNEVLDLLPYTKSGKMAQHIKGGQFNTYGKHYPRWTETIGDEGSAARFFYCAKTSRSERNQGLDDFEEKTTSSISGRRAPHEMQDATMSDVTGRFVTKRKNIHPTVKPIDLMKYLCRLVTPKGGIVLDPFMGSGSTGMAAKDEDLSFIGIEKEEEYFKICQRRIESTNPLAEFYE